LTASSAFQQRNLSKTEFVDVQQKLRLSSVNNSAAKIVLTVPRLTRIEEVHAVLDIRGRVENKTKITQ